MTDAAWVAMSGMVCGALTYLTTVSRGARKEATAARVQSVLNAEQLAEVHEKVNGNLDKARNEARRTSPAQVLVIDDDHDHLDLQARILRKCGCEVFLAKTGAEAKALIMQRIRGQRGWPFDFILLDMKLAMGETAAEVLLILDKLVPWVPVAILTGYPEIPARLCQEGRFVITKPLTEDHVRRIKQYIGLE